MYQKFTIIVWFTFFFGVKAVCQNSPINFCETPIPSLETKKVHDLILKQIKEIPKVNSGVITYIPVKIHLTKSATIYANNDFYPLEKLNQEFGILNKNFAPIDIQFFISGGIDYITNDIMDYYNNTFISNVGAYNVANAINVYYINYSNSPSGRSNFPSGLPNDNWLFVQNFAWQRGEVLVHEMGHYFNLFHTFETFYGAELVTRNVGANCSTTGDLLCDTPADPNPNNTYNRLNCTYTGLATDALGSTYNPSISNFMSYFSTCSSDFSTGQKTKMLDGHALRLSLIASNGNLYNFSAPVTSQTAPSNVQAVFVSGKIKITWVDNSSSESGYLVERSLNQNSGFECIGGVGKDSVSFFDYNFSNGIQYFYRIKPSNHTTLYSALASVTVAEGGAYCIPYNFSDNGGNISSFRVHLGSNPTPFFTKGSYRSGTFSDFTKSNIPVTSGSSYVFYTGSLYFYHKVWLDINQNQLFEEPEVLFSNFGVTNSLGGNFTLPANLKNGKYRLRVRISYYDMVPFNACQKTEYGETEDYTVTVTQPCGTTLTLSGPINANQYASSGIQTTGSNVILSNEGKIGYKAPSITLNAGFRTQINAVFEAKAINGCL